MEYIIENDYLKATINSFGAELVKLVDKDGINRMHVANSKTWNRVSPILFPQISRTKDYVYVAKSKQYQMPQHGLFRDEQFSPISQKKDEIVFLYEDNERSLEHYPYHFSFYVTYRLVNNRLDVICKTINKDDSDMYYMVGGHPGFKVPLYDDETYEDYYIEFEQNETVSAMQVVDGYLANVYKPYLNNEKIISLRHDLFIPDAIVLKNLKSTYADLKSKKHDKAMRFYFKDYEILAFWSLNDKEANYVCFEPWNGIQKDFVPEHEKMGVLKLKGKESSSYTYSIEIIK